MSDNRRYPSKERKYYKTNFVDFINLVTPELYEAEDLQLSGKGLNPLSDVINRHVSLANDASAYFSISSIDSTKQIDAFGELASI